MLRFTLAIVLSVLAGQARAGCENYTDGSLNAPAPLATICFEGKCEKTTLDFLCSNIHGTQIGYANGWRVDDKAGPVVDGKYTKGPVTIYRVLKPEDYGKLTCKDADGNSCW